MTSQAKDIYASSIACVKNELAVSFFVDITLVHSHITSQIRRRCIHFVTELIRGCRSKTFIKWVFVSLPSWDHIWLVNLAVDKQTLLNMLLTRSGCELSTTKNKFCFRSACFRGECWIIYMYIYIYAYHTGLNALAK